MLGDIKSVQKSIDNITPIYDTRRYKKVFKNLLII